MNTTLIMAFILILIVVATVITKKLPFNFVLFIAPVLCALILGHSIEETSTFIVEQLASMLGISTKTASKLVKEKQIKSVCIGRIYKIPKIYVLEYLQIPF